MRPTIGLAVVALVAGACGDSSDSAATESADDLPNIVVTTTVLADMVTNLVGDLATVESILPPGSDPHDFQASAQQVNSMHEADVLVTNGAGFEAGLIDQVDSVESAGTPVCVAIDGVDTIEAGHSDDHGSGGQGDGVEGDGVEGDGVEGDGVEGDEHGDVDPHFFTDPARAASASEGLLDCIAEEVDELDGGELRASGAEYIAELGRLDAEVAELLASVPAENRVMVTNHDVFGYFADRYDFEVAGAVIDSTSTQSQSDAAALAALAETVRERDIPAVFTETSSADDLARTLAGEAGDVEVVALFSESLGPDGGETYVDMVRTNARRVSEALQ